MPYAESSSGQSHCSITASTKVLDPSNTAHALSSHQEAQKRAIKEACLCPEAEKQQGIKLSTPVTSSSNLSAPVLLSVSRTTSPARCSVEKADLSFSDSASEDNGNPCPPQPRNGKGIDFYSFYLVLKLSGIITIYGI